MIGIEATQALIAIRESQKNYPSFAEHPLHITEEKYTNCVAIIFKVRTINFWPMVSFFYEIERMEMSGSTKFLAKKYFDIFLATHSNIQIQSLILIMISCIRCAVKVNQCTAISEQYNIQFCIEQCDKMFTAKDFLDCQMDLCNTFDFKMKIITPYDYYVFNDFLPFEQETSEITQESDDSNSTEDRHLTFLESLEYTIDLCLTIPEIRNATSQGIFFSSMLYCCKLNKKNQIWVDIIKASTISPNQVNQILEIILKKIEEVDF